MGRCPSGARNDRFESRSRSHTLHDLTNTETSARTRDHQKRCAIRRSDASYTWSAGLCNARNTCSRSCGGTAILVDTARSLQGFKKSFSTISCEHTLVYGFSCGLSLISVESGRAQRFNKSTTNEILTSARCAAIQSVRTSSLSGSKAGQANKGTLFARSLSIILSIATESMRNRAPAIEFVAPRTYLITIEYSISVASQPATMAEAKRFFRV